LTRHEPPQGRKPPPRDAGSSTRGRREYVRVEGAGSAGVPAGKGARAQDRKGREPTPGRSRHLHDAIRERFPNFREFDAWNERHATRDSRFLITAQLFIDIDRGHTPTLHHLYALASASGWPLERVCREFDVDFCELPRLHGALGRDRTELRLRRTAFSEVIEIPMDLAPGARPNDPVPLRDLVAGWSRFSGDVWPLDSRYLTAQIGLSDNLAFPRLPSGAEVLVDCAVTRPHEAPGYYAVQHPNGFSCCQVVIDHGMKISLLSESREVFPRLDYALRDVRIRGRVAAIAGRVDRLITPRPVNLNDLLDEQRALLDPDRFRDLSSPAMLRDLWARRRLTFSQFEEKVRRLRLLAGSRFRIGRGHMHDLMQADATSQDSVPRLETFFALAAIFLLDPVDLLRGYNMPPDSLPLTANEDAARVTRATQLIDRARAHRLVEHLERRGWALPWLLSMFHRIPASWRAYYLGDAAVTLSPLVGPDSFVIVNTRQRRVLTTVHGRPISSLRDWMRPVYLLQTNTRRRYVCGYCEMQGEMLHVIPHPEAPSQRVLRFRCPEQAIVIGRVTHVATLL
jgi:hypothetical protein